MEKEIAMRMETLPYPAVAISAGENGVIRNRFARRLLPPVSRLRGRLLKLSQGFLEELRLDGITYLVLSIAVEDGALLFCFFENFLHFEEAFSRAILGKMQDFFWSLLSKEGVPDSRDAVRLDQIAARAGSLRMHGENYLRLVNRAVLSESGEAKTCSLGGFFGYLQKALESCGISVSFRVRENLTVYSESAVLSFLVLNLIHFVRLFEAREQLCLEVTEMSEGIRFRMEFSDQSEVRSSLEDLILYGKENPKLLFTMPMLCILRVCMEKGIPWSATENEGRFSFSFLLAKGDEKPILFLSDAAAEASELLQMIRGTFF